MILDKRRPSQEVLCDTDTFGGVYVPFEDGYINSSEALETMTTSSSLIFGPMAQRPIVFQPLLLPDSSSSDTSEPVPVLAQSTYLRARQRSQVKVKDAYKVDHAHRQSVSKARLSRGNAPGAYVLWRAAVLYLGSDEPMGRVSIIE